jgi:methionyl-tRNA formyltransferase
VSTGLDRVALITINPGGPFVASVLAGCAYAGIHPAAMIVVSPWQRLKREWKRHRFGVVRKVVAPRLRAIVATRLDRPSPQGEARAAPPPKVIKVPTLNGPETQQALRELGTKYLINAGAGIFRAPIIDLPGLVVLNAHAGALPQYRNMNVVEWALEQGSPVVATVHVIDSGLDTGPIVLERALDLSRASSLDEAREMAFDETARLFPAAIMGMESGELHPRPQPQGGKTWYTMHSHFQTAAEQNLIKRDVSIGTASDSARSGGRSG